MLVNDKLDGHSIPRECPPPVLHSSTEKVSSEQDQQESSSSSLGNSIGGKRKRIKRQAEAHDDAGVVDVVFLGDGHKNNTSNNKTPSDGVMGGRNNIGVDENRAAAAEELQDDEEIDVIVEKRILLNISIGMDGGIGSPHLNVYQLQVAVPLPKQAKNSQNFFSYNVVNDNLREENLMLVEATTLPTTPTNDVYHQTNNTESNDDSFFLSSTTTTEQFFDDFIEASSEEGLKKEREIHSFKWKILKTLYNICNTNGIPW